MDEQKKGHKPKATHPWRKVVPNEVLKWAKANERNTFVNSNKKGGGLPPWNSSRQR